MKRAGIFAFFDDEGYVDKYVEYLLDDITQNLDRLVIVCNGFLTDDSRRILEKYTPDILMRPDTGYDIGGFKFGVDYMGWDALKSYDEVVLFNDSFFGPLYPFKIVFDEMDSRSKVDFWGLSMHGAAPALPSVTTPYDHRYRYLQTYFLSFRKRLVCSEVFQNFWNEMAEYETANETAANFGPVFTKLFGDSGFQVGVYSDTADLESEDIHKNVSNHTFNLYEMVANRKFPIIKRRTFITPKSETLRYNYGHDLKKAMDYVEHYTTYDTALIYRYLLRKYNIDDLKKSLNLLTILPGVDIYGGKKLYQGKKIALFLHTGYPDLFDYDLRFLKNLPPEIDVIVTNRDEKQIAILREKFGGGLQNHLTFIKVEQRGRDMSALLVGCHDYLMQYEYICFIHDKKSSQKENTVVGASFRDLLWENTLFSTEYVSNILNRFEENPCLGLQVPPNVYHGTYFNGSLTPWTICYDRTVELAYSLGMKAPFDRNKDAFSVGSVFWARTDALKTLFMHEWTYHDFPGEPVPADGTIGHAIERIFPYVAQHNGYYTEYVLNSQYAASELVNYRTMHVETVKALSGLPIVCYNTHALLVQTIRKIVVEFNRMYAVCRNYPAPISVVVPPKYQKYQLTHSFLIYADKKLPLWLSNMAKHMIKVPKDAAVSNAVGLKGALVLWGDARAPRFIGKLIHKLVKM